MQRRAEAEPDRKRKALGQSSEKTVLRFDHATQKMFGSRLKANGVKFKVWRTQKAQNGQKKHKEISLIVLCFLYSMPPSFRQGPRDPARFRARRIRPRARCRPRNRVIHEVFPARPHRRSLRRADGTSRRVCWLSRRPGRTHKSGPLAGPSARFWNRRKSTEEALHADPA